MLVFVDESGDPGMKGKPGTSPYFVITLVLFSDPVEAEACDLAISRLRADCRMDERTEFHFSKCSDEVRARFLECVARFNFQYFAIVLNKGALYKEGFQNKDAFYKYASRLVFENARDYMRRAKVVIDKCGDQRFKRQLGTYLQRKLNDPDVKEAIIRKVTMEDSARNNLLQLADMVCGAVARSYRTDRPSRKQFREIVKKREFRVQFWPKK